MCTKILGFDFCHTAHVIFFYVDPICTILSPHSSFSCSSRSATCIYLSIPPIKSYHNLNDNARVVFCVLRIVFDNAPPIFENNSFFASLGTHYFTFNTFVFFVSLSCTSPVQNSVSNNPHFKLQVTFVLDKHLLHDVSAQPSIAILHIPTCIFEIKFLSFCSLFYKQMDIVQKLLRANKTLS